jgi:ubiquinone/menaquinone biosynthesis C-methylase UbiE
MAENHPKPSLRRILLLKAFDLLYNQLAWAYDAVSAAVSLGRWRDWGRAALPFLPGPDVGDVLEMGHGPGYLLAALAEGGWRATGLDSSTRMSLIARRRLSRRGLPARIVRGRGQALPFPDASFNSVVAAFPAPYIVASETVSGMWRVLRAGGRLVIVPQAELTGKGLPARAIQWLYAITGQRGNSGKSDAESDELWTRALGGRGFHIAVHRVRLMSSIVTVVVAERPRDS